MQHVSLPFITTGWTTYWLSQSRLHKINESVWSSFYGSL